MEKLKSTWPVTRSRVGTTPQLTGMDDCAWGFRVRGRATSEIGARFRVPGAVPSPSCSLAPISPDSSSAAIPITKRIDRASPRAQNRRAVRLEAIRYALGSRDAGQAAAGARSRIRLVISGIGEQYFSWGYDRPRLNGRMRWA